VSQSLTLLSDVSARTAALLGSLTCPSGPAVGRADALGPVPATCAPVTETPADPTAGSVAGSGSTTGVVPSTGAVPTPSVGADSRNPGNGAGVPAPRAPSVAGLPSVTVPPGQGGLPSLPSVSLPGASSGPVTDVPNGSLPADLCLPPLATVGHC
jgi:hypothetical protein